MLAITLSATLIGLDAEPVRVEVDTSRHVPYFELVGLAETSVRESRVRVKSALRQIGLDLSEYRVIVNLAPADVRKNGSSFDLAIAVAILASVRAVPLESITGVLFLGELSLSGNVHPLRGVLPHLINAKKRGDSRAIVPRANEAEAALVSGIDVRTVDSLPEIIQALRGDIELPSPRGVQSVVTTSKVDNLDEVHGQFGARRALEIAASGGHNLLMIGPPGSGKTMLARRLPGILPPLSNAEALEVTAIHSVAGLLTSTVTFRPNRPFRSPHHSVSDVGLIGGGEGPRPGEVTLAHHGVLFLDELPEFRRSTLEGLRLPLEDGVVTISRARAKATFPAQPMLVCAMNPCPCGFLGDGTRRCACSAERVRTYRSRLSGPLLDRIDIHVVLPPVKVTELQQISKDESTETVCARVAGVRAVQRDRASRLGLASHVNSGLTLRELELAAPLCSRASDILASALTMHALSARAYTRVLRIARTIADMAGEVDVSPEHIAESVGLRVFERGLRSAAT